MRRYVAVLILGTLTLSGCGGSMVQATPSTLLPAETRTPVPLGATSTPSPAATPSLGSTRVRARDGMLLVYVPEGTFTMGSDYLATAYARNLCREYVGWDYLAACQQYNYGDESPAHAVTLAPFWIDQTEVTNMQYQKCDLAGVCKPPAERGSHDRSAYYGTAEFADFPVISITRSQAMAYCEWVGGRLPTEAEWEYAARGPDSSIFPWGNTFDGTRLNYCDANCDPASNGPKINDGYSETAPVGSFPSGASWVGALDMAGNVREWVDGWYGPYSRDAQINPHGPERGELIIPRGGSWIDNPSLVRSANRGGNTLDYYRDYYGFRCVEQ